MNMTAGEDNSGKAKASKAWYGAAVATAAVAGVFSLTVVGVLAWNRSEMRPAKPLDPEGRTAGPLESQEFRALKARLKAKPTDQAIKQQIREIDLTLREEYFRRQALADRGRYMLVGGAALFLIAALYAVSLRKKLPSPSPAPDPEAEYAWAGRLARWSVAGVGVILAGSAAILAMTSGNAERARRPTAPVVTAVTSAPILQPSTYPSPEEIRKQWPRFRGPGGLAISAYTNVPDDWDGKTGEGILWKSPVPLPGENSPVVWKDRVFLTGATAERREVYCFGADSGRLLWRRPVTTPGSAAEPPEVLEDAGFAAPTAAVDGQRVYAVFANGDLACFDFSGREVWARSLGKPENTYGHASSLVLNRDVLLVQYDQASAEDAESALLGLDVRTGRTLWQVPRPVPNSWATPIVIDTDKARRIITCANPWVIAYDAATAAELWRANCLDGDVAPSPVYAGGLVFAVNAEAKLAAIRTGGLDDVTKTHILWTAEDGLPDISSPLATDEFVFLATTGGMLTCYAAKDGKRLWEEDLDANFQSSPSLVGNRVYLLSEKGVMFIFEAAKEYRQIGRCELGEGANTCPAFLDERIYIRAKKNLYCIGRRKK